MSKTMKRVSALLLAILMIVTYMPMMQETAYAAKKKAKKIAKVTWVKGYPKISGAKKNQLVLKWKKAKNAKKYLVSITHNGLTATKTTKKKTFTLKNCQYSSKYTVKVRGINGKKKGPFSAKKSKKFGADPSKVAKSKYDALLKESSKNKTAAEQLKKDLGSVQSALENLQKISGTESTAVAASKEAVEEAKKTLEDLKALQAAYADLGEAGQAALDPALKKSIEDAIGKIDDLENAIQEAEAAIEEAQAAEDEATLDDLDNAKELKLNSWNPEVKRALNDMITANSGKDNKYVVFDFDNTCSIFDVEEQLGVYQLQTMAFDETVTASTLADILSEGLNQDGDPDLQATYDHQIHDITAAFAKLDETYDFTPAGLTETEQAAIQATDDWKEFATKMRNMYDIVGSNESVAVSYPWILYWFTGMTHAEVYELAKRSHEKYNDVESEYETWESPASYPDAQAGQQSVEFTNGTTVSDNIRELMAALDNNGIDVWVCSASATDPIRAAIDVWGLHDHVTGMMAMTNVYNEVYEHHYDYENGVACIPTKGNATEEGWTYGTDATKAQTQGKGKVTAVQNVCGKEYGCGPIAGFMDSTGDYNFCTEFKDLEVVCCFNRANRKQTDGGGVIAEVAVYEADTLGYDYAKAREAGDTLYVLQGRDERDLRSLNASRKTYVLGKGNTPYLFRSDYKTDSHNQEQLDYMIANNMSVADAINKFAQKKDNPFDFSIGFLDEYDGYHSQN